MSSAIGLRAKTSPLIFQRRAELSPTHPLPVGAVPIAPIDNSGDAYGALVLLYESKLTPEGFDLQISLLESFHNLCEVYPEFHAKVEDGHFIYGPDHGAQVLWYRSPDRLRDLLQDKNGLDAEFFAPRDWAGNMRPETSPKLPAHLKAPAVNRSGMILMFTEFADGGLAVVPSGSHCVVDMAGYGTLMREWAASTRGSIINRVYRPASMVPKPVVDLTPDQAAKSGWTTTAAFKPSPPLAPASEKNEKLMVTLSPQDLALLKARAQADIDVMGEKKWISTNDALNAFVWRTWARIAAPWRNDVNSMRFICNARGALNLDQQTSDGNIIVSINTDLKDVASQSLGAIALNIRDALKTKSAPLAVQQYMQYSAKPGVRRVPAFWTTTQWSSLYQLDQSLDFGSGAPLDAIPISAPSIGFIIPGLSKKSLRILISVPETVSALFQNAFAKELSSASYWNTTERQSVSHVEVSAVKARL